MIVFIAGSSLMLEVIFDVYIGDLLKWMLVDVHFLGKVGNPRVEAILVYQDHL